MSTPANFSNTSMQIYNAASILVDKKLETTNKQQVGRLSGQDVLRLVNLTTTFKGAKAVGKMINAFEELKSNIGTLKHDVKNAAITLKIV